MKQSGHFLSHEMELGFYETCNMIQCKAIYRRIMYDKDFNVVLKEIFPIHNCDLPEKYSHRPLRSGI